MSKKNNKAAAPTRKASVIALLANAATAGYAFGSARADAARFIAEAKREASQSDYLDICVQFKAGRIVSYFENPPKAQRAACQNYVTRRWDNLDRAGRIEAAVEIMAKTSPQSEKPNRRTETEHKACRAADTALSEVKRDAGIAATKKGGRKPRPSAAPVEGASVTVASPKFTNDNEAVEFFGNVAAAMLATVDKNNQTGCPKSVKQVMHRVGSIVADFKRQLATALNSGE